MADLSSTSSACALFASRPYQVQVKPHATRKPTDSYAGVDRLLLVDYTQNIVQFVSTHRETIEAWLMPLPELPFCAPDATGCTVSIPVSLAVEDPTQSATRVRTVSAIEGDFAQSTWRERIAQRFSSDLPTCVQRSLRYVAEEDAPAAAALARSTLDRLNRQPEAVDLLTVDSISSKAESDLTYTQGPERAILHYVIARVSRNWVMHLADSIPHQFACEAVLRSMQQRGVDAPPLGSCAATLVTDPVVGVRFQLATQPVTMYLKDAQIDLALYLQVTQARTEEAANAFARALTSGAILDCYVWYGLGLTKLNHLVGVFEERELSKAERIPHDIVDLANECKVAFHTAFVLWDHENPELQYRYLGAFCLRRLLTLHYLLRERELAHEVYLRLKVEFNLQIFPYGTDQEIAPLTMD
eukprot:CAMPEP_0174239822 /NCGR_PEP_ID=MMETSP0417-20130205/16328_1 /TAXON_ID=242541 /ORGANISM="Mayorella sp, Strain BSH-02190019" /LENGTH=413 /DNA_ID=CAMNT_0015318811 /DNA_START=76 /DNA_END=1317 /DNA_ORIENTATION=-